ncbi:MAG: DUF2029 domain-containing protein [Flavobacteriales bacterium]|nr:DUF2029 domain-containing protein [Flavobacteriales bacterium]
MPLRWQRFPGRFQIIFLAIAALLAAAELINGRFWLNDFRVYYDAANALLNGEPLYGVPHGLSSGYFKYAPFMAMLYVPLALLPYTIAAGVQYALIACAFIGSILIADRLVRTHVLGGKTSGYTPLFVTSLVVVVHLHRELHLGNINVLLLWLLLAGLDRLLSGRAGSAGLFIGLAMLAKPHFVVLLPLLLVRGHARAIAWAFGTAIAGLLLPVLFLGHSASMALYLEWFDEMAKHNASLIYTGGDAYNSVDTVYSFVHRAILKYFVAVPSTIEALATLGCIATTIGAIVIWNLKRERGLGGAPRHTVFEYFLLLALVPSITLTDTNHFLFSMPLVMLLMHHLAPRADAKWLVAAALPFLLAYGGNWSDALGDLSDRMVHYGVLGIANLGLIALGTILLLRRSNLSTTKASS